MHRLSYNLDGTIDGVYTQAMCVMFPHHGRHHLLVLLYLSATDRFHVWPRVARCLTAACGTGLPVLVAGDFNACHAAWGAPPGTVDRGASRIRPSLEALHLDSLNARFAPSVPTRLGATSSSVIDLAFASPISAVSSFHVDTTSGLPSDHSPIVIELAGAPAHASPAARDDNALLTDADLRRWSIRPDTDWSSYAGCASTALSPWFVNHAAALSAIILSRHPSAPLVLDDALTDFCTALHDAASHVPGLRRVSQSARSTPWWRYHRCGALYREMQRCRNRWRRHHARADRRTSLYRAYVVAKRRFAAASRNAKADAWRDFVARISRDGTASTEWSTWQRMQPSSFTPLTSIRSHDGALPVSASQALEHLATHYAAVSTLPAQDVFCPATHAHVTSSVPDMLTASDDSADALFTHATVSSFCERLRTSTAPGSDAIAPHFIRHGGADVHRAFALLLNASYASSHIPASLRSANVVSLYKGKGDPDDPSSYRPISLTSVIVRLMERIIMPRLLAAVPDDLLHRLQFGFRSQRCTLDNLAHLSTAIHESIAARCELPVAFLDISKAFDRVWLDGMVYKLYRLGVRGRLLRWVNAFVRDRRLRAVSMTNASSWHGTNAGVPQGSVLAPFLFLVFINDLPASDTSCTESVMFADDVALIPPLPVTPAGHAMRRLRAMTSSVRNVSHPLQLALDNASLWAHRWKVTFSIDKSNVVVFRPSRRAADMTARCPYALGPHALSYVNEYRYMGLIFSSTCRWSSHVAALKKRVAASAHAIARVAMHRRSIPLAIVRSLCVAITQAQIRYGLPFWSCDATDAAALDRLLLLPMRLAMGQPNTVHRLSMHHVCGILPAVRTMQLAALALVRRCYTLPPAHPSFALLLRSLRSRSHPPWLVAAAEAMRDTHVRVSRCTTNDIRRGIELRAARHLASLRSFTAVTIMRTHPRMTTPAFFRTESFATAALRARIWLCRTPLAWLTWRHTRHLQRRLISPHCSHCGAPAIEDESHVLLHCRRPMLHMAREALHLWLVHARIIPRTLPLSLAIVSGSLPVAPRLRVLYLSLTANFLWTVHSYVSLSPVPHRDSDISCTSGATAVAQP
jgi:hypothetical protein